MRGRTQFGDSIDDEWFIVYILYEISKKYGSKIGICVHDSDGQFLLIEAADHLPMWIGPENSDNRVWIKDGHLHLIPLDETRSKGDGSMVIYDALYSLQRENRTKSEESVQSCISKRIACFPEYAFASMHKAMCTVPKFLAKLLATDPQLISAAVSAFCSSQGATREKKDIKAISAMKRFGSYCSDSSEYVSVPVVFSRAQYARLSFQKFHPPRKFHNAMINMKNDIGPTLSSERTLKSQKAFDLGVRITCGFELCYQNSLDKDFKKLNEVWSAYLDEISYMGYFETYPEDSIEYTYIIKEAREYVNSVLARQVVQESENSNTLRAIEIKPPFHMIIDHLTNLDRFANMLTEESQVDTCDNDDWLFMSPEDFEAEMNRRVARGSECEAGNAKNGCLGCVDRNDYNDNINKEEKSIDDEEGIRSQGKMANSHMREMENIVSSMKTFMNFGSDYEGIEPVDMETGTGFGNSGIEEKAKSTQREKDGEIDMNDFNVEKFINILQSELNFSVAVKKDKTNNGDINKEIDNGYFSDGDYEDEYNHKDNDDYSIKSDEIDTFYDTGKPRSTHSTSTSGVGSFVISGAEKDAESIESENIDSDDEKNETDFDNPDFMDNYLAAMEEELGNTTLIDTFEKTERGHEASELHTEENGGIDFDLTVIKNLLESHSLQIGGIGPASALLAQMGLKFPTGEVKEEDDENN